MTAGNRIFQRNMARRAQEVSSIATEKTQDPQKASAQRAIQAKFGHSFARLVATTPALSKGIPSTQPVQRVGGDEEELQMKADPTIQRKPGGTGTPNNTGLPDNVKTGIESHSGVSLDDVKVHYNSSRPAQLQALAYTQGTDIHVAPGQEQHVPHEAWHVVQQKQGRVQPTMSLNGAAINDDPGLEGEADHMASRL